MCELTRAVFSSVLLEAAATQLSEAEAAAPALRSQVRDSEPSRTSLTSGKVAGGIAHVPLIRLSLGKVSSGTRR